MRNKELKNEAWTTSRGNIKSIFASKVSVSLSKDQKISKCRIRGYLQVFG